MKKALLFILVLLTVAVWADEASAQRRRSSFKSKYRRPTSRKFGPGNKNYMFGGHMGYSNYFGDLAPKLNRVSTTFNSATPYISGFVMRRVSPHISWRASAGWVRIEGDDINNDQNASLSARARYIRNLHFRNDMFEGSFHIVGDLFPTFGSYVRRVPLNPYGFVGVNVMTNNPMAKGPVGTQWEDQWIALHPLKTAGQGTPGGPKPYSTVQIGIPFGVGFRYRVGDNLDLGLEFGYRFLFTNYIDDVGGDFPDPAALGSELARRMSNRSAERYSAYTNERREIGGRPVGGANPLTPITTNQFGEEYVRGWEPGASPRGGSDRDYIVTTSIHLTYILSTRRGRPKKY